MGFKVYSLIKEYWSIWVGRADQSRGGAVREVGDDLATLDPQKKGP